MFIIMAIAGTLQAEMGSVVYNEYLFNYWWIKLINKLSLCVSVPTGNWSSVDSNVDLENAWNVVSYREPGCTGGTDSPHMWQSVLQET